MALVKPDSARIAKIRVIGVGGGGGNAISSMIETSQISGVEFIAVNTDAQVLLANKASTKIQIGEKITKGLGVGGNPDIGFQAAEESVALTVAIVTKPFSFEGTRRMVLAEEGIEKLKEYVDTLIVIPNQRLMDVIDRKMTLIEAFKVVDSVLGQGILGH